MSALIVGTMPLSLEEEPNASLGIDAYEEVDRVDLIVSGFHDRAGQIIALTRYEAERLADYLRVACSRGKRA